jgi:two-component system sensor histidine kinase YesM
MMISYTISNEQKRTAKIAPRIEEAVDSISDYAGDILSQPYCTELFDLSKTVSPTSLSSGKNADNFSDYVSELVENSELTAVRFYMDLPENEQGFFLQKSSKNLFLPESQSRGTYWHGIFQSSTYQSLHCPTLYLGSKEKKNFGDCAYIYRCYINYNNSLRPCYLALYYSSEVYTDILCASISDPDRVSYIINERDASVATTDASLSGIYRLNYSDIKDSLMSSNNFIETDVLGNQVYVDFHYMSEANWVLVTVIPRDPLIKNANWMVFFFVLFCAICIILAVSLALVLTRSITTRVSALSSQMEKTKSGTPEAMPEPVIRDEIGNLISSYNYMTKSLSDLMEAQKKSAEELKMSEFHALQAQINPHFLYNIMDLINWMVLQGKKEKASAAIQLLARFYKLTLRRDNEISTIGDELEHVSSYMELQNMRYNNAFNFVIDMPDELSGSPIPQLTLQPIVENSILHGILETDGKKGTILITGWQENEDICILVSDDGAGISPEVLPQILSEGNRHSGGGNIAVYNIHNRLRLLYGEGYGLSYSSTPGEGCEVTIRIPFSGK